MIGQSPRVPPSAAKFASWHPSAGIGSRANFSRYAESAAIAHSIAVERGTHWDACVRLWGESGTDAR
jgi:hypothetical protein